MFSDYAIPVLLTAGVATAIAVAFTLPPLTFDPSTSGAEARASAIVEKSHCEDNLTDVDCKCYAKLSSYVLDNENKRIPGMRYANQQQLARSQAQTSC